MSPIPMYVLAYLRNAMVYHICDMLSEESAGISRTTLSEGL